MIEKLKKLSLFLIISGASISVYIFTYAYVIFDHRIPSNFDQFLFYDFHYYVPGLIILIGFILYLTVFAIDCIQYYKKNRAGK